MSNTLKRQFEEAFEEPKGRVLTSQHLESLEKEGYVIVRNLVSESFVGEMNNYIDQWFNSIPCYNGNLTSYQGKVHNIMKGEGVGHNFANWMLRLHPNVIGAWCDLCKCDPDELVVSLDGFRQAPSSYKPKKENGVVKNWTHVDEGDISKPPKLMFDGSISFQMSVALSDVGENDGCFLCIPQGHKYFKEIVNGKEMFQILSPEKLAFLAQKGLFEKRITGVKKGDAIIWNSKTPHRGDPALVNNGKTSSVIFACYTHRENVTAGDQNRRKEAFGSLIKAESKNIFKATYATSSHSPGGNNFKLNSPPRIYGDKTKEQQELEKKNMRPSEKELVSAWDVTPNVFSNNLFRLYHSICSVDQEFCKPFTSSYNNPTEKEVITCFKNLHEQKKIK